MRHQLYKGRKFSSFTLSLLCVSFIVVLACLPTHFKNTVSCMVYPFLCVQQACMKGINYVTAQRLTIDELQLSLQALQEENRALMSQLIEQQASTHYIHGIEELCAFKKRYHLDKALCTQILSKTFSEQGHSFLVNAGSVHGVEVDMIALYNNVLLGRVEQVYPYYSKVIAVSDKACKVAAYCITTGAAGIHEGCNKTTTLLSHISHLEKVNTNDLVISSGQGLIFPQGFALGRIADVSCNGLFYTITVTPLLCIEDLSYCMLLHKNMIPL